MSIDTFEQWLAAHEAQKVRDDLDVGAHKPLGYWSYNTREEARAEAQRRVEAKPNRRSYIHVEHGRFFLYVWDERSLSALLRNRILVLRECYWPTTPCAFVLRVCAEEVTRCGALRDLIADAFADRANLWRTDCRSAAWYTQAEAYLLEEACREWEDRHGRPITNLIQPPSRLEFP